MSYSEKTATRRTPMATVKGASKSLLLTVAHIRIYSTRILRQWRITWTRKRKISKRRFEMKISRDCNVEA